MNGNGKRDTRRVRVLVSYDCLASLLRLPPGCIVNVIKPLSPRHQQHLYVEVQGLNVPEVPEGMTPPLVTLEYPVALKAVEGPDILVPGRG